MNERYGEHEVTDWHSVASEPKKAGFYQILYEGDNPLLALDMYSFRYWDGHNWRIVAGTSWGCKSVFGNHQRDAVEEYWRGLNHG